MHYANARVTFDILAADGGEENQVEGMFSLYGENISLQHIDYNIMYYGGKFRSLYTFNSALSLILFEAANCMNNDVRFVKCPVCGHYFVPEGRSDTLYCSFPSPKDPARSCQEIGAQVTRANAWKPEYLKDKKISFVFCDRQYYERFLEILQEAKIHNRMTAVLIDVDVAKVVEERALICSNFQDMSSPFCRPVIEDDTERDRRDFYFFFDEDNKEDNE